MSYNTLNGGPAVSVRIASTLEDLFACQRIRSACFLSGDQPEPYLEQFDANDFSAATHLIAEQEGAPVGTLRIRILNCGDETGTADATWEKLAVLPGKRGSMLILNALAKAAVRYSVMKGVTTIHGLVMNPKVAKFWKRTVGGELTNDPPIFYEDRQYRTILINLQSFRDVADRLNLVGVEPETFARLHAQEGLPEKAA